jgi:MOB kinase activator 1
MASILHFLSPRAPKILSPICTLTQSALSMTILVKSEEDPIIQAPQATYVSPYSQKYLDSNQRTKNQFRPRNATKGTTSYQLRQYAEATLGGGSLRKIVKLPEGEDENEWLAVNSKRVKLLWKVHKLTSIQWWTSTITSTFSMDRSPSSAPHNHVPR